MLDFLLDKDGDLLITPDGDIVYTNSVSQAICIRLRWFLGEWKYGPDFGVPYYESILVKNPSKLCVEQLLREQILSVKEVTDVTALTVSIDEAARKMTVCYSATVLGAIIREEESFDV